jgi:cytochrome c oxidase, subunit II
MALACTSAIAILAAACGGNESAFQPAGPQAGRISSLWWYMFSVSAVIWVLVLIFLGYALQKARRQRDDAPSEAQKDRTMKKAVVIATAITVLILIVNLVYSVTTGSAMAALPRKDALRIDVEGKQWWWQVTYEDPTPGNQIVTANEIHVPVGEPIQIIGTSHDVIHSFWAPNLFGKKDLIPGHTTATWFQADTAGVYRGQCAEFCGYQHAKMAVIIVAEPRSKFEAWYKAQQLPAAPPSDSITRAGEQVFMSHGCPVCHTVGGTRALGTIGPNLTHIGSSLTIAAGSLKNTPGNLAGWIVDPQQIKPGVHMPPNDMSGPELQAILAYLENLK